MMSLKTSRPGLVPLSSPSRTRIILAAQKAPKVTEDPQKGIREKIAGPALGVLLAAVLSGAVVPEEALAARSGGRIGGSAFRSAPRAMPRGGRTTVQNNYYGGGMMAPPLIGGGYGYGGGFMPSMFFPIGFGGGFVQLFITLFVISSVLNAIQGFTDKKDEDDFDNFD